MRGGSNEDGVEGSDRIVLDFGLSLEALLGRLLLPSFRDDVQESVTTSCHVHPHGA